jgi:hypothetical protein
MRLTFNRVLVLQLLKHSEESPAWRKGYDGKAAAGLHLVGDHGVYLMSTGDPILKDPAKPESSLVCYANECNPDALEFNDWWEVKQETFGGDDGVEFISAKEVRGAVTKAGDVGGDFFAEFDEGTFSFGILRAPTSLKATTPAAPPAPPPKRKVLWK